MVQNTSFFISQEISCLTCCSSLLPGIAWNKGRDSSRPSSKAPHVYPAPQSFRP